MEIHILDKLLRPIDVVDVFESMIWVERNRAKGDFELVTLATVTNKRRFVAETWISIAQSDRVMEVQRADEAINADGRRVLTVKGIEIVDILDRRGALQKIAGVISPTWLITAKTPGDTMRYIFDEICRNGTVSANDVIPFITAGNLYPADSIAEPADLIEWEQKPATVYGALKELADIYDLGFRLYKDPNLSKLYFNVYAGSDRTSNQDVLPPVVFSTDMENLDSTTEFSDISTVYNVIQVVYTHKDDVDPELDVAEMVEVYENDIQPPSGFERRVKMILVTSIPEGVVDIPAFLIAAGKDELMKSRPIVAFDGEITQYSQFVYGRDYYLGDLVEQRGDAGATSFMRVEEYIFVEDMSGQRSYPTLMTEKFVSSGSWKSWKYAVNWNSMGAGEYWSNQ